MVSEASQITQALRIFQSKVLVKSFSEKVDLDKIKICPDDVDMISFDDQK